MNVRRYVPIQAWPAPRADPVRLVIPSGQASPGGVLP